MFLSPGLKSVHSVPRGAEPSYQSKPSTAVVAHGENESAKKFKSQNSEQLTISQQTFSTLGLWMLIDGIGLAIIEAATILEGAELWKEVFHSNWDTNSSSLMFWLVGRSSQILGLLFLIGNIFILRLLLL
jgi:hypothetical protein